MNKNEMKISTPKKGIEGSQILNLFIDLLCKPSEHV